MTIEEVKKMIFKAFKDANELGTEYSYGLMFAYDRALNLLSYVEEPTPMTEDEVKNHVIGLHNYCISKTDCKDCLFRDGEGFCNFMDNYLTPSQWNIPAAWKEKGGNC